MSYCQNIAQTVAYTSSSTLSGTLILDFLPRSPVTAKLLELGVSTACVIIKSPQRMRLCAFCLNTVTYSRF